MWDDLDLEPLFDEIRADASPAEAERLIWAIERVRDAAALEEGMIDYLLVAAVCLEAVRRGLTPRQVLDRNVRSAIPDEVWLRRYAPLLQA